MHIFKKSMLATSLAALAMVAYLPAAQAATLGGTFTADNGSFV